MEGITELQELRADLSERTAINFSRTAAGLIAFTKVRLEVYAVPMRWSEQLICSQEGALVVQFQRGAESVDGCTCEVLRRLRQTSERGLRARRSEFHVQRLPSLHERRSS